MFARINGVHSIRQIAQQTALSEFDVARIIYGFLSAGLVVLTKQVAAPPNKDGSRPVAVPQGRFQNMNNSGTNSSADASETPKPRQSANSDRVVYDARPKKNVIRRLIDYFGGRA